MRYRLLALALAAALGAGCESTSAPASPIHGDWVVDLDATLANASALGAGANDLRQVRETYADGKLRIEADRMVIGVKDMQQTMEMEYSVLGTEGDCARLSWKSNPREQKYCVRAGRMEVTDPGTPLVVVYRRG